MPILHTSLDTGVESLILPGPIAVVEATKRPVHSIIKYCSIPGTGRDVDKLIVALGILAKW